MRMLRKSSPGFKKLYQLPFYLCENVTVCFCSRTASLVSLHLKGLQGLINIAQCFPSAWHTGTAWWQWFQSVTTLRDTLAVSGGALSSVRNSCLVQPDKKTDTNAWVSSPSRSPSRNPLSTVAVKKTTWDCPLKNHKEPEQKIYKKPNLVVKPLQLVSEVQGLYRRQNN